MAEKVKLFKVCLSGVVAYVVAKSFSDALRIAVILADNDIDQFFKSIELVAYEGIYISKEISDDKTSGN